MKMGPWHYRALGDNKFISLRKNGAKIFENLKRFTKEIFWNPKRLCEKWRQIFTYCMYKRGLLMFWNMNRKQTLELYLLGLKIKVVKTSGK